MFRIDSSDKHVEENKSIMAEQTNSMKLTSNTEYIAIALHLIFYRSNSIIFGCFHFSTQKILFCRIFWPDVLLMMLPTRQQTLSKWSNDTNIYTMSSISTRCSYNYKQHFNYERSSSFWTSMFVCIWTYSHDQINQCETTWSLWLVVTSTEIQIKLSHIYLRISLISS